MEFIRKAQNLKKGLPCFGKRFAERCRRFCAVLLCASMVVSGFPSTFFQAFASDGSEEYCYELERESLCEALLTAVSEGSVLGRELDFKGEYAEQYSELFAADGTLYELKDIDIEKDRERDKILDLRVFVRIEGDVPLDAEYEINGEEEFIFLIISRSEKEVKATICLDESMTDVISVLPLSDIPAEELSVEKAEETTETGTLSGEVISTGGGSGSAAVSDKSGNESFIEIDISEDTAQEDITEDSDIEIVNDEAVDDKDSDFEDVDDKDSDFEDADDKAAAPEEDDSSRNDDRTESDNGSSSAHEDKDEAGSEDPDGSADTRDGSKDSESSHDVTNDSDNGHDETDKADSSASVSSRKTDILTASLETEPETGESISNETDISSPSDASPSDIDNIINGYIYGSVRFEGRSAGAFITTADDLGLSRQYVLNEETAYDRISAYMENVLERSARLEKGEREEAEDLWNELMDVWEIIYEARDNETLKLTGEEYETLDRLTDEICQNLILAGYNPYGIMTLDDYTVEVMGSFTLSNTGWTASSSDRGEVRLTTGRNTTTVMGVNPGKVTLTRGSGSTATTHTITIPDTFRVCVYVSAKNFSQTMLDILGIDSNTIDPSGYFPAGIVSVPAEYLSYEKKQTMLNSGNMNTVPLITSEEDWQLLLNYLKEMDTSEGVFESAYKGNAGNNVYKYFEDAQEYLNNGSGSENTALFYQTGGEGYSEAYSDVVYHFDLLFYTNTVTYFYGNNGIHDGQGADDGETAIGATTYIRGVTIDEANPTFLIPDGYVFEGYYIDPDCTDHWDSSKRLTGDMEIYIKLTEGVTVTVEKVDSDTEEPLENAQFLLCKIVEEEIYDDDGNPVIDQNGDPVTETCLYYYDFNEYTGWIADKDQATPKTTTGTLGEFEIVLAGFDEGDTEFKKNFCYFLWEVEAPAGYKPLDEPIFFTVTHNESDGTDRGHKEVNILAPQSDKVEVKKDDDGFDTLIYIKNEQVTFPVDIFKYTENDVPLAGAEFVLSKTVIEEVEGAEPESRIYYGVFDKVTEWDEEKEENTTLYKLTGWSIDRGDAAQIISGEDGFIHIKGLPAYEYVLTEVKAPDGYMLPADSVSFILDSEGKVNDDTTIRIENIAGSELPETGGRGTLPFTLTGLLMMGGSALIYLALRRRKVRVG